MRLTWLGGRRSGSVAELARAAFAAGLSSGLTDLTAVADTFEAWARQHGTRAELAEAHRMRVMTAAREARRRGLLIDQYGVLGRAEHAAAEAGHLLAADEQGRDAVAVVELSRAVVLTRMIGGLDPLTRTALRAAGRDDLITAHERAIRLRADAYRRLHRGGGPAGASLIRQGRAYATGVPFDLEHASAEVTRVRRASAAITGPADPLEIPAYAMIQQVASQAPVVYLASADESGYALIVRDHGEPQFVRLPALRLSDEFAAQRQPNPVPATLAAGVRLLTARLGPLVCALRGDPEIALVPVGGLDNLPFNAALLEATIADPAREPLVVRSLPNARAGLGRPLTIGPAPRVLVVDATEAPGQRKLRYAHKEAATLAERYGPAAHPLSDASRAQVLDRLADADLVQFFGHGQAEPADPLLGGLELMDGRLSVGTLMGRPPGRPQLVVLAACESQFTGATAPNEAVGLPAALIQAGAAGVVAAQWQVNERAAMLLLNRFHDFLAMGRSPARALTMAQCWLRGANGAEIAPRYPGLANRRASATFAGRRDAEIRYAEPVYWAAFGYTGR
ncbi:CHAT domain-containing protein [Nonomuraea sp. H19]|uniref:CHAT domain-containing protein n=1 Tax=Nonomuraea sp. H19 TaxID=3452206 RepID=UPI003F8AB68C